jgi:hypothetical protein
MTATQATQLNEIHPSLRNFWFAVLGFSAVTLLMFGDVLFGSGDIVLTDGGSDTFGQFLAWRKFGFEELKKGNLALWNPYVFCGAPFFGGFQSALLYPLNALYLVLPLTTAVNYSIALHVFLAGLFVFVWASYRRLHPLACFLAGVVWMFSGPYFLNLFGGHLSNLSTIIWAPLVFLAIDRSIERPGVAAALLGMTVVSMQILAGHPQYVFYTNVLGVIYLLLRLQEAPSKARTLGCLAVIYLGAAGLSSVQILSGMEASHESIRGAGTSTGFAGSFSLPPENLVTLIAPGFFGDNKMETYWGRWSFIEMCVFSGVTTFVLAAYAILGGYNRERSIVALIILVCCLIAFSSNTKLFELLYQVPGFALFRGWSKFASLMALFIALLAAMGLDDMIRKPRPLRKLMFATALLAICLAVAGVSVRYSSTQPNGMWRSFTTSLAATEQAALPMGVYSNPQFLLRAGLQAEHSLLMASAVAGVLTLLLIVRGRTFILPGLLALAAFTEVFLFARNQRDSFNAREALLPLSKCLAGFSGEGRVYYSEKPNLPMFFGIASVWGNDPGIPLRLAEFIGYTQKLKLEAAAEFDIFKWPPFFKALRCQYLIRPEGNKLRLVERPGPMPHLKLISHYRVIADKKNLFAALNDREFEPAAEVILESEPSVRPDPSGVAGEVKLMASSTDFLDIEAELPAPAILLITDTYTPTWRAVALPGSSQSNYKLQAADYCLRGVPLAAGHHKLRVEYSSKAFAVGKWVSLSALAAYLSILLWYLLNRKQKLGAEDLSIGGHLQPTDRR